MSLTNENSRLKHQQFGLQPWTASGHLMGVGLLVHMLVSFGLPHEVLDGICDIDLAPLPLFRFGFQLFMLALGMVASSSSLAYAQSTNTSPLHLFINGGGTVSPLTNGELLQVGQNYSMTATPDPGFVFSSWQPANVFTFTQILLDASGNPISTNISVVPSLQIRRH